MRGAGGGGAKNEETVGGGEDAAWWAERIRGASARCGIAVGRTKGTGRELGVPEVGVLRGRLRNELPRFVWSFFFFFVCSRSGLGWEELTDSFLDTFFFF